ncbi:regulating synaptic membrane exocytosis protein 2-like [Glandiceps talaboti]
MFVVQLGSNRRRSTPNPRSSLDVDFGQCQMLKSKSAHAVQDPLQGDSKPAMPDLKLDHLTKEEVAILRQVFEKQEAFERAEEERIRNLDTELRKYEEIVTSKETEKLSGCLAPVDLRLCRLCYSKKFADGVGRACYDCHRRVCVQCGSFNISFDESEAGKYLKNKWRCKMCELRRQLLCQTGQWYHGDNAESQIKARHLKEKIQALEHKVSEYESYHSDTDHFKVPIYSRSPRRRISHQEFYYTSQREDQFLVAERQKPRSRSVRHKKDGTVVTERETATSERRRRVPRRERRKLPQQHWRTLSKKESTSDSEAELKINICYDDSHYGHSSPRERRISQSHSSYDIDSGRGGQTIIVTDEYDTMDTLTVEHTRIHHSAFHDDFTRQRKESTHLSPYSSGSEQYEKPKFRKQRTIPKIRRMETIDLTEGDLKANEALQHVDCLRSQSEKPVRRLVLHQEYGDKSSRTNGYGMRVIGGKVAANGTLGAYVTKVIDGGPAMVEGCIKEGDQIMEWEGISLINKTFEEVKDIVKDSRGDVSIVVLHKRRVSNAKLDRRHSDNCESSNQTMQKAIDLTRTRLASQVSEDQYKELVNSPSTPRRKLPKSPVDLKAEQAIICGRLHLSMLYNQADEELIISVYQAENLPVRQTAAKQLSNPYVKIYLLPHRRELLRFRTDTAQSTSNPVWSKTFIYPNISKIEVDYHSVEFTVWDDVPNALSEFMGEVLIDLRDAVGEPRWFDLAEHDENSPPLPKPSPTSVRKVSPCLKLEQTMQAVMYHAKMRERMERSMSISEAPPEESEDEEFPGAKDIKPLLRKLDELNVEDSDTSVRKSPRSSVVDICSTSDRSINSIPSSTQVSSTVHNRNRASTAPEHLLSDSNSQSLSPPGSPDGRKEKGLRGSLKERLRKKLTMKNPSLRTDGAKRSISSQNLETYLQQHDKQIRLKTERSMSQNEIGSSLPKSISENWLALHTRRFSWLSPEDRAACRGRLTTTPSVADDTSDTNSINSSEFDALRPAPEGDDIASVNSSNEVGSLGPGQYNVIALLDDGVKPVGAIKVGIVMTKGHLEVEVVSAKGLTEQEGDNLPDTYVKTYLVEGNRRIQKKKTRVVKQSIEPAYRQMIRYSACDVYGRNLQIMIWEKLGTLQHNRCIGEVQITLDELELSKHTVGWYTLFPSDVYNMGSSDSINSF